MGRRRGEWYVPVECGIKWSGKSRFWDTSIPDSFGGVVDVVEVPGGCPWRCRGRDGEPWRSPLEALTVCEEGGAHSEEVAVPAAVRGRGGRGRCRGLLAWSFGRGRVPEEPTGKLSLGPRESGMVGQL